MALPPLSTVNPSFDNKGSNFRQTLALTKNYRDGSIRRQAGRSSRSSELGCIGHQLINQCLLILWQCAQPLTVKQFLD